MMGQLPPQQNELFYDFCLDKHIPEDHLLRQIDQFLDFEPFKEHLKPQRLLADTAYGSAHMLGWLVEEKAIAPHIPVWERSNRTDGTFLVSDFKWDAKANEYRCPANKALLPRRKRSFCTVIPPYT